MPKFTISLAMNIRAYGFVEVEADDIEAAKSQITADKLRNEFQPHGTGIMNSAEHGRSLIRSGACCAAEDWPKLEAKTKAGAEWAKAQKGAVGAQ